MEGTGQALDYRETVEALTGALPELITGGSDVYTSNQEVAEHAATALARAGFTLVRMQETAGLTRPGMEAVTGWFSREEDV